MDLFLGLQIFPLHHGVPVAISVQLFPDSSGTFQMGACLVKESHCPQGSLFHFGIAVIISRVPTTFSGVSL